MEIILFIKKRKYEVHNFRWIQIIFLSIACITNVLSQVPPSADQLKIKKLNFTARADLTKSFFLNDKQGWVISSKYVFKTNDGGIKWQKINIQLSESEKLTQISFLNSKVGTIIVQKILIDLEDNMNYFRILGTKDGGITWEERQVEKDAIVQNIVFTDEETGWIAGYKKKGHSVIGYKYLLLRTRDKGETWEDFSSKIETEIFGNIPLNYQFQRNIVLDATVNTKGDIQLFTNDLNLLTSSDYGATWSKIQYVNKGKSYGLFRCSGNMDDGKFWYARSSESSHGIYGEVGIWSGDSEVSWNGIAMNFFGDVVYLDKNKFIAVGRNVQSKTLKKEGVILYTEDSGKTWHNIYTDKTISTFNSITKLNDIKLIAVGASGAMVLISLKKYE